MALKTDRDGYSEGLVEAGMDDRNVVVLTGDLTESVRVERFSELFPDRFIEVGIAEQNMMGIAAGLALSGKIPFVSSYAVFSPGRNLDQIRLSVCFSQANVKIVSTHAGLATGADGGSAQALEDIAIMRSLPNMTVIVPCDAVQAKQATLAIAKESGPAYMRLTREPLPVLTSPQDSFEVGKAQILLEGRDVTVIACGPMVHRALEAAKVLESKGILAEVINLHTVKPLDEYTIISSARKTGGVVTVEDHQVDGGMGGAVSEVLSREHPTRMHFMGVRGAFGESGSAEDLYGKHGLTPKGIVKDVLHFLGK